jgi:hypothetical protein
MNENLVIYTDTLDDQEKARIALSNRIFAMKEKGLVDPILDDLLTSVQKLEKEAERGLKRHIRKEPLYPWISSQVGLGEKQVARLLGAIGDPYLRPVFDDNNELVEMVPRTVSQLWGYCGMGVVDRLYAPRYEKGVQANWNDVARMRIRLIAESCMKQKSSPYRSVYDDGRAKYKDAVHKVECKQCGPKGNPAQIDSPLNDGHQHARALRLVSKAILKDLWIEGKRLHETKPKDGTLKPI